MSNPAGPERDDEEIGLDDEPGLDIEVLRRRRELVLTFFALALIVGVTIFSALKFFRTPPPNPQDLVTIARLAVRQAMPGKSVEIGVNEEMTVTSVTDRLYDVSGRFYAIDPEGRSVYYVFTCSIEQPYSGSWRPAKLTLTPMF